MQGHALFALSPLDGRYHAKVDKLADIFSERGFIKYRVMVEIRWLQLLASGIVSAIPKISPEDNSFLTNIILNFTDHDAAEIKSIEEQINHDVKAIEYFIKRKIGDHPTLAPLKEFIHFGCTSEDINNIAYGIMVNIECTDTLLPALRKILNTMKYLANTYADIPMLARTHGQPATPTTLGKEFANFAARLQEQIERLAAAKLKGKMNGAVGNYNALTIACPEVDWMALSKSFVQQFGLEWNQYTTQIEPHDTLVDLFATLQHINTILIGFARDMWSYIKDEYFLLKNNRNEVGSSTMPHKINPIDFENAEGNLGVANSLLGHFCEKLPISRLQRDLSDSTVLRNIGVAFGNSFLAYQSLSAGLSKVEPNVAFIKHELNQHWEVLAEAVQTVMRLHHIPEPYEKLKAFTRGKPIDHFMIEEFIKEQPLPEEVKNKLLELRPDTYTGYANRLAHI